jgi:3-polyprenyl-4-hydroxybenzoate decarboxylase
MKRIIVGISGASGAIYGIRMLQILRELGGAESHLVMSPAAQRSYCRTVECCRSKPSSRRAGPVLRLATVLDPNRREMGFSE